MELVISGITLMLGLGIALWPERAAAIWGWKELESLPLLLRIQYLRLYRGFGILLCAAGLLAGADRMLFHLVWRSVPPVPRTPVTNALQRISFFGQLPRGGVSPRPAPPQ